MARPLRFPAVAELTESGSVVLFRSHYNPTGHAKDYAKRKGFAVTVDRQDEHADVTADAGYLWKLVRL